MIIYTQIIRKCYLVTKDENNLARMCVSVKQIIQCKQKWCQAVFKHTPMVKKTTTTKVSNN